LRVSRLAHAGVALAQFDAGVLRCGHQLLPGAVEQPAVGGMRDGLGLHRGVHDHRGQARRIAGQFVAEAALAAEQSIGEASFTNS